MRFLLVLDQAGTRGINLPGKSVSIVGQTGEGEYEAGAFTDLTFHANLASLPLNEGFYDGKA